jgi:hypothetical protein
VRLNWFFFFDRTQELVFIQEEEQYRSEYKLQTSKEKPEGKTTELQNSNYNLTDTKHTSPTPSKTTPEPAAGTPHQLAL